MITGFYAGILALLFAWVSLYVVKTRRKNRVGFGDGGIDELQRAISAHSNMAQYSPVMLLLLFFLEYQHMYYVVIHIAALAFILGRLLHFKSMISVDFKKRVWGMQLTLYPIMAVAALNIIWPLYRLFLF